ncbi:MAG: phage tail tip lysozyme [Candidatus Obscuribacterales bacterium]
MDINFYNKWTVIFMEKFAKDFSSDPLDGAAVFGNAGQESGGYQSLQEKKPIVPGSRGGYGIFQWTGPRRKEFEAYCKRNGFNPSDMEANYKFFYVEMNGSEGKDGKVLERLKAAKGLDAKTEVFMKEFLRPGIPHLDSRKVWAKRALSAWESRTGRETPPAKPEVKQPEKESVWLRILRILLRMFVK